MIVQIQTLTRKVQEEQIESDGEINDNELADHLYMPRELTDYEKSQQVTKDQLIKSHTEETKYLVLWSYLLPLFRYCLKCPTYATIKVSVLRGSMLIVTHLCAYNHSKQNGCWEYFFVCCNSFQVQYFSTCHRTYGYHKCFLYKPHHF